MIDETDKPDEAVEAEGTEAAEAAEAKPKPKRAPRARKPKAAADEAVAEPEAEEKPKPKRASRAKAKADVTDAPVEKKPAKPAPARKTPGSARGAKEERADVAPPLVRAHARYVRSSARKARLVCDHIRGKSVPEARAILAHTPRHVARDWTKLLESAVANAEHNHELVGDDLRVVSVKADEGPTIKRFQPRAMGRATQIRKRTAHLSITLTPKD
ncbi:MAG: large subunit ribosomal protein [Thermoleophilaceae bacterium]|nr:large subunit ribosomal protein [Thermoleophilaceae bacterium]